MNIATKIPEGIDPDLLEQATQMVKSMAIRARVARLLDAVAREAKRSAYSEGYDDGGRNSRGSLRAAYDEGYNAGIKDERGHGSTANPYNEEVSSE